MIRAHCQLRGDKFYPSKLDGLPELNFWLQHDPGDIGVKGRFKGEPIPWGHCYFGPPESFSGDAISWMANLITQQKSEFVAAGATKIVMWIKWYGIQGNMEYTVEQLQKLAAMGVPLAVDYVFQKP